MPFAIVADLPLGTYRGASADGRPERIPSVARLHSALLSAAGFGPRAVEAGAGSLEIRDADAAVLRWLEDNPPDQVHIPALEVSTGTGIAYRDDGTLKKHGKSGMFTIKKLAKVPGAGTAVDGKFAWIWAELPPEPIRAALEQLCPDVPYLGTSESPVRLSAVTGDTFDATHDLDQDAGLFTAGATGSERPVAGRLAELSAAHRAMSGRAPSAASDRYGTDEKSLSPVPPRQAVETAWYSPRRSGLADVPWPQVITIPVTETVPERDRVAWAVAVHRALIKMIGFGAPAVITGTYAEGARRPANRIALHLLGRDLPAAGPDPCLAVLVPVQADPADVGVLQRAVENMTAVRGPRGKLIRLDTTRISVADGGRFWPPPQPGCLRLWRTVPAAIPDTRGARVPEWNFAHAALLSLGFTCKDTLPKIAGRGAGYYRGLAMAAAEAGASVVHTRAVRTQDIDRYVHKVNQHAVVRPYTACLSLGNLAGPETILAIGQTRHLGGGLLVPFDVPEGTPVAQVKLPGEREA